MEEKRAHDDKGRFFEDFEAGQIFEHDLGRTVTDNDNIWFSLLTCNANQIHFNKDYALKYFSEPPFNGRLLVNAALTFSIIAGLSVADTSKNGIMLGLRDMKISNPVFDGDTLYAKSTVLSVRQSKSHPGMGIVVIKTEGYKQDNSNVIEFERTFLVRKRNKAWH